MKVISWTNIPVETLSNNVHRQVVWGKSSTLARFSFAKDLHVTAHRHDSEQYTCVMQGALKLRTAENPPITLTAGEMLLIPGGIEHEVWVLEDSIVIDFFAPSRLDWQEGSHQYLTANEER
jgi:quercetin dioxygenase-like cupin family protein